MVLRMENCHVGFHASLGHQLAAHRAGKFFVHRSDVLAQIRLKLGLEVALITFDEWPVSLFALLASTVCFEVNKVAEGFPAHVTNNVLLTLAAMHGIDMLVHVLFVGERLWAKAATKRPAAMVDLLHMRSIMAVGREPLRALAAFIVVIWAVSLAVQVDPSENLRGITATDAFVQGAVFGHRMFVHVTDKIIPKTLTKVLATGWTDVFGSVIFSIMFS